MRIKTLVFSPESFFNAWEKRDSKHQNGLPKNNDPILVFRAGLCSDSPASITTWDGILFRCRRNTHTVPLSLGVHFRGIIYLPSAKSPRCGFVKVGCHWWYHSRSIQLPR